MSARAYLVTEGVHDVFFLGKLLVRALGFKKVESERDLESEWRHLLPKYPYEGSLRPSVPAPTFYRRAAVSVVIVNALGIDRMAKRLGTHWRLLGDKGIHVDAVGAVLDADFGLAGQKNPSQRFAEMADVLENLGIPRPAAPEVVSGTPRAGIFILPGGDEPGTLEDLLLECAAVVYPALGCRAVRFVDGFDRATADLDRKELEEFGAAAGRNKAVLAAMAAILKPGKPIQASIEDHRWIESRTLALPRVAAVVRFLDQIVGAAPGQG